MHVPPRPRGRRDRLVDETEGEYRSAFRRDRDRIVYAPEFRRLKDVTQVARSQESYLYHDRLTHSEKVAQVGESVARILVERERETEAVGVGPAITEYLDPHVVEAACLAHDIGHPPFGHVSEGLLDDLVRRYTADFYGRPVHGYEGNAQSFRIVTRLANQRDYDGEEVGLNLTRATLNAILKYPWSRDHDDSKWGYYGTERDHFEFARRNAFADSTEQSLEAEIMDYADDLTYAVHDVEDFYKSGLIPLDQLFREATSDAEYGMKSSEELSRFVDHLDRAVDDSKIDVDEFDVVEFFDKVIGTSPFFSPSLFSPFGGTDSERKELNEFVSGLISRYLESDSVENPQDLYLELDDGRLTLESESFETEIEVLKQLTVHYVINDPTLMAQQRGQKQVIRELFEALYDEAAPGRLPSSSIPSPYRERLEGLAPGAPKRARAVADMIAALTEPQAVRLHKRLTGDTPGSLQNRILR